jgi:Na+-driven multidrug efflux pump
MRLSRSWILIGPAGALLLAATMLPPKGVWLGRPLLLASLAFAILGLFFWSRRRR